MGTTTHGLPWPNGTDFVVDGDDAIRALAEKIDALTLPFGYARARCLTAAGAGPGAWNVAWLDAWADQHGHQPWTLEAASRRIKVLTAGVYSLSGVLTMNGTFALGVALSADAITWDRVASVPIGGTNYTNSVSTVRYIPANTYVALMMYQATTLATVADTPGSPSYLAIQALGGTAGIIA